jgi:hypothetical protein
MPTAAETRRTGEDDNASVQPEASHRSDGTAGARATSEEEFG